MGKLWVRKLLQNFLCHLPLGSGRQAVTGEVLGPAIQGFPRRVQRRDGSGSESVDSSSSSIC